MRPRAAALAALAAAWSSVALSSAPSPAAPERRTFHLRYAPADHGARRPPFSARGRGRPAPPSAARCACARGKRSRWRWPRRIPRSAAAAATGYVRAEVRAADGALLALTNPIYVVVENRSGSNRLK